MLDPRFRGDDKCAEHPSVTEALLVYASIPTGKGDEIVSGLIFP
jgi:hypothetical protein